MLAEDDTTKRLARIWQELLGVGSIGIDQNYFDLGGDSPLAIQLFSQIEKVFNVKLPLATLFEAPTIRELASILRCEAPTAGWSPMVPIQPKGSRPPFFCIHGAGGNVLIYRDLSLHLGSDQPFYGLQSPGLDGSRPPLTRIEEMATLYVREIRRVQPSGPYFVGGYCMGGTIAFEIAQQLRAQGEQIALLALFDTLNWYKVPLPSIWGKTQHSGQRLIFHAANFFSLDSAGKAKFFLEKVKVFRSRIPVWRGMLLRRFARNSPTSNSKSRVLGQVWEANDCAGFHYDPRPYPGVITEFRPRKQYRLCNKPELKWDRLAQGGQEIVVLPVYPAGMLVEPFVKHLAAALMRSIDAAIHNGKAS
jgi:thioesterase domain-containing protein/acyl carrier protein